MEEQLLQKIENAPKPDFGDILSKSFELFKKTWEQAAYHALITLAAVLPMILIIYIPYVLFIMGMSSGYGYYDSYGYYNYEEPELGAYWLFMVIWLLLVFALIFVVQAFVYGITAHYIKYLKKTDLETDEDIGGYFACLKGNYVKLLVLSLATFGIAILATLLCYFPIFYVMVPLQLLVVFFAFHPELSVSQLIKVSFKLGHKYWLIIFGLLIISQMIAQIGILLCGVGIFLTAYFVNVPMYYVYKDCIGFDEEKKPESDWQ